MLMLRLMLDLDDSMFVPSCSAEFGRQSDDQIDAQFYQSRFQREEERGIRNSEF